MFPVQGVGCERLFTSLRGQSQLSLPPVKIPLQIMSWPLKTNHICIQELWMFPFRLSFHPLTGELEIKGSDCLKASFPFHPLGKASCRFPALSSQMLSGVFPLVTLLNAHTILSKAWKYGCRYYSNIVSVKPTLPQIKTTRPRKDREENSSYLKALEREQAYGVEKVTGTKKCHMVTLHFQQSFPLKTWPSQF